MIKIRWTELDDLIKALIGTGMDTNSEVNILIFRSNSTIPQSAKIKISSVKHMIYDLDVEHDDLISGIFIYNKDTKQTLWSVQDNANKSVKHVVPVTGNPHIILNFKSLRQDAKDLWVEITESAILNYNE